MKKIILSAFVAATLLSSCSSNSGITQHASTVATLIQQLSPNSKAADIARLFTALDTNNNEAISLKEAKGTMVADNFKTLDTNNNNSLNLDELTGILALLKK